MKLLLTTVLVLFGCLEALSRSSGSFNRRHVIQVPYKCPEVVLADLMRLSSAQIDWCSKDHDCVIDGVVHKHTMCDKVPNLQEFVNIKSVLTEESRKYLLKAHNVDRNSTAGGHATWPKGANIRQLTWDYTLEDLATHWALVCKPDHDVCRKTPEYPVIGQNIGAITFKEIDPHPQPSLEIIEDWIKAQNDVDTDDIKDMVQSYKNGTWYAATQIWWAETTKMGCGEVTCIKNNVEPLKPKLLFRVLVCNYAPGGNLPNMSIYKTGEPCADGCPSGTKCNQKSIYPLLCATPGDPIDDSTGVPPRPTPGPGPTPTPGPGPTPTPGPGPTPTPGPPGPTTTTTSSTGSDSTTSTLIPTTPTIPNTFTIPTHPQNPFISDSIIKTPWCLYLLLCLAWLLKLI